MTTMEAQIMAVIMMALTIAIRVDASDTNDVYDPCSDAKIQRLDGFSFGLAFSTRESFFFNQTQLSPCDKRLSLSGTKAQLAVYRPKVDEVSLLTIDSNTFDPNLSGGYMVAFAGSQYAARSVPVLVADNSSTIASFTLVLEFQKGTLENLHWKKFGCKKCSGDPFICLNNQDCAIRTSSCKRNGGGTVDCSLSIQLAFSGTDKNYNVLNSWYEVEKLRQYSLFSLFSDLRNSIPGFTSIF